MATWEPSLVPREFEVLVNLEDFQTKSKAPGDKFEAFEAEFRALSKVSGFGSQILGLWW